MLIKRLKLFEVDGNSPDPGGDLSNAQVGSGGGGGIGGSGGSGGPGGGASGDVISTPTPVTVNSTIGPQTHNGITNNSNSTTESKLTGMALADFLLQLEDYTPTVSRNSWTALDSTGYRNIFVFLITELIIISVLVTDTGCCHFVLPEHCRIRRQRPADVSCNHYQAPLGHMVFSILSLMPGSYAGLRIVLPWGGHFKPLHHL